MDNDNRKRTREELIADTFRLMIRTGEAHLTTIKVPLSTGGILEKRIYRVEPRTHKKL